MTKAFTCAVRLLARREYGAVELSKKLLQKGYTKEEAKAVIAECQRLNLQNDARYAEQLCRTRIAQGYGPLRISQELQALHIDEELIHQVLTPEQENWIAYAKSAWQKKFKAASKSSAEELLKQRRFLMYRGFSSEIITRVFK